MFKNFIAVSIFVIFVLGGVFYFWRDAFAGFVWEKFHNIDLAFALENKDPNLAMHIGAYYFNSGGGEGEYNLDKAIKAYEKAVSIKPEILWGHYQLARLYFIKANFNKALEQINKELEYNPENLRSLYVRGLIYGYSGELEKAEKDFRGFVAWAPSEWAGYNDLVWILQKEQKYEEAEEVLKIAFKKTIEPDKNPWLWNALGVTQLNQKKYVEAKESFEKAKEFAGKLTEQNFANSYPGNNPGQAGEGLEAFKEAINENLRKTISY